MIDVRELWNEYCDMYRFLVEWMKPLIGPPEAAAVARRSLSMLVRLSWAGYQTQEGPFADLVNQCVGDMASHGLMGRDAALVAIPDPSGMLGSDCLAKLCSMYAASYYLCYEGQWTMNERETICQYLRTHDPKIIAEDWCDPINAAPLVIRVLLRRALVNVESWYQGGRLVDEVAKSIRDDEVVRSIFWARQFSG